MSPPESFFSSVSSQELPDLSLAGLVRQASLKATPQTHQQMSLREVEQIESKDNDQCHPEQYSTGLVLCNECSIIYAKIC